MNKLKIGFVLDDTLDSSDGIQQYILTLGAWYAAQGHEIHYLVGQTTRTDVPHVHSLSRNLKARFNGNRMSTPLPSSRRQIKKLLADEKFDVLHVQIPYSPFMAGMVIMNAPAQTVVFGTFHIAPHSGLVHTVSRLGGVVQQRSLKRFDQIVSVSRAAAEFARQTFRIDSYIVPNVVETRRYKAAKAFPEFIDVPTVVFVGRLVPRKGCDVLLQAVAELQNNSNIPGLRVIICGRGPLEAELKAYVAQNNLTDVVSFAGFVSEADKARYLKSASVAVFPSTGGESFGIVLIEAMAAETPVVLGTNNPGYRTVLEDYPDILVPIKDPYSLANKLEVFLTSKSERARALEWQREHVKQFDVAVVGTQLLQLYEKCLTNRRDSSE